MKTLIKRVTRRTDGCPRAALYDFPGLISAISWIKQGFYFVYRLFVFVAAREWLVITDKDWLACIPLLAIHPSYRLLCQNSGINLTKAFHNNDKNIRRITVADFYTVHVMCAWCHTKSILEKYKIIYHILRIYFIFLTFIQFPLYELQHSQINGVVQI